MPKSYQEQAELRSLLAKQAYFDAIAKLKSPNEAIQVVGTDGQTGRKILSRADGGVTSNGVQRFNTAVPQDGFVAARIDRNSNAIAIDGRQRKEVAVSRILDDEVVVSSVKYLQTNVSVDYSTFYIGGDREEPELIFTVKEGYTVQGTPSITTLGTDTDQWIVQVVSVKKEIVVDFSNIVSRFQSNPNLFKDAQILSTITANGQIDIYSDGVTLADGSVFTGQESFRQGFTFQEYRDGSLTLLRALTVIDTYTATANIGNLWTYERTDRQFDITYINPPLTPESEALLNTAIADARDRLTANPKKLIDWRNVTDTGITPIFEGYTIGYSFQGTNTPFPTDAGRIWELPSTFGFQISPLKNGWWFDIGVLFSKNPSKWFGGYSSFGATVNFNKTNFTSDSATNSILVALNSNRSASIPVKARSFGNPNPDRIYGRNINVIAPTPSGGYKPLIFIQGWNKETQLIKVLDDWRLYLKDGSYSVVKIPKYDGNPFIPPDLGNTNVGIFNVDLIGDCLYKFVSINTNDADQTVAIVGARLTASDQNITKVKKLFAYGSDRVGQIDRLSVYIGSFDEYNALENVT